MKFAGFINRDLTRKNVITELTDALQRGNADYVSYASEILKAKTGKATVDATSYFIWWQNEPFAMKPIARMAQLRRRNDLTNHTSEKYAQVLRRFGFEIEHNPMKRTSTNGTFDSNVNGQNANIYARILARPAQSKFRKQVFQQFGAKCIFTGCRLEPALEAGHIIPYALSKEDIVTNGLPMRRDIHKLFDLGLIALDPENERVLATKEVKATYELPTRFDMSCFPPDTIKRLKQLNSQNWSTKI